MKPVSMWITLGMSLFIILNTETLTIAAGLRRSLPAMGDMPPTATTVTPLLQGVRRPIPAQGEIPPDPAPLTQKSTPGATPTTSLRVPPEFPPGGIGGFNPVSPKSDRPSEPIEIFNENLTPQDPLIPHNALPGLVGDDDPRFALP